MSQGKQCEIAQQGVVEWGVGSAICSSLSFGCVVGLLNKIRKISPYSFRVLATRLCESKITSEFTTTVFILNMYLLTVTVIFAIMISDMYIHIYTSQFLNIC